MTPLEASAMSDEEISKVLDLADIAQAHFRAVRSEAFKRANKKSGKIKGYKIVPGANSRDWIEPDMVASRLLTKTKLERGQIMIESLASPAMIEKQLKTAYKGKPIELADAMKFFNSLVKNTSSANQALVRDIDPREEVKRGNEFKGLAEKYGKSKPIDDDDLL